MQPRCLELIRSRPVVLRLLAGREAEVLRRHCLEAHDLADIAWDMRISAARAGQLHARATRRLAALTLGLAREVMPPLLD